ncbi:MAG: SIS domain-containing protein [Oscillospiraceae bacterium]|nr:SIS domain-containing protein [Oscillospiraceae bacterium]
MEIMELAGTLSKYADTMIDEAKKTDWQALARIVDMFLGVKRAGGAIFTAGNGGSHATASHMANDFIKGCRAHNRTAFRVECLGDANAIITCLANDFSYDDVYAIMLQTKGRPGDVLAYYSGSGNSPNLVNAAKAAREMGIVTVGFLGRDGGALKDLSDYYVIAPSDSMERIEDIHMMYEHNMVCAIRAALEDEWGMEIVRRPLSRCSINAGASAGTSEGAGADTSAGAGASNNAGACTDAGTAFKYALFDFDGTLSLIREGWQEIMIPYFIEVLRETPQAEDVGAIEALVTEFVDRLTGKQTIFQCIRLDEEVVKRGGQKIEPGLYKDEYLRRLNIHIKNRIEELRGGCDPQGYLVPGSVELLERLASEGWNLYCASGTDEVDVLVEAKLLGMDKYFGEHIYGAHAYMTECSKEMVIREIIAENGLTGAELVAFGDGFVEIELVAGIGGYTVGVATDEVRRKGVNLRKRGRLLEAGADVIIPDFGGAAEARELVEFLLGV